MNKNKKEIIMISIMILVLIIGVTYAYFLAIAQSSELEITSKQLKIVYDDGTNVINAENIDPIYDDEIFTLASKKTFTIAKTEESSNMFVKIDLIDLDLTDNFKDYNLKWGLYDDEDNMLQEGSFGNLDDKKSIPLINNILIDSTTPKEYHLYIYIEENDLDESRLMEGSITGKIEVTGRTKRTEYKDNSGANQPKLAEGMIPVIYDWHKDKWIKEENDERYYDYDSLMWANAVTVTSDKREDYMNAPSGTVVEMNDINSMWVWIPRYKYRIPESIGISTDTPPKIDIVFENGTEATGVEESEYRKAITTDGKVAEGTYYTHPSFRDGTVAKNTEAYDIGGWDKELTGMWISKFETGGTADYPIIKPDIKSYINQSIPTEITASVKIANGTYDSETDDIQFTQDVNNMYGFNTKNNNINTHILKSIDWGAVSYLSQSGYGKMGNSNYEQNSKEVYINNSSSIYTGRSSGSVPYIGSYSPAGGYSYNDYTCEETDTNQCMGNKVKYSGIGASTTGTIYGIYDMVGGSFDLVMSRLNADYSKYFDSYTSEIISKENTILGDARWETKGWYKDYGWGTLSQPTRGGPYYDNSNAGLFRFGISAVSRSFHIVLIP